MISQRQKDILWTTIEAYAKAAEPVSSKALAQQRGFGVGAPMIRKEMNQLEKEGYLASPHTSAGRVPTDKAYRLYIQEQLNGESKVKSAGGLTLKESQKIKESLNKNWPDEQTLFKEISRVASEISAELSVAGTLDCENTYSCGLVNLSREPEFQNFNHLGQLMRFMDNVDLYFERLWQGFLGDDLEVFIGSENPIKEINEFTLITGRYQLPRGQDGRPAGRQGFVSIIGPKRMNYKRNMGLVEYISEMINSKLQITNYK